uniref:hypothetical protein n=1 Tax=Alloprevotella sp. TaxID=1872471 RepID=UPI003FEEFEE6
TSKRQGRRNNTLFLLHKIVQVIFLPLLNVVQLRLQQNTTKAPSHSAMNDLEPLAFGMVKKHHSLPLPPTTALT